jgi:hypothetical protein
MHLLKIRNPFELIFQSVVALALSCWYFIFRRQAADEINIPEIITYNCTLYFVLNGFGLNLLQHVFISFLWNFNFEMLIL